MTALHGDVTSILQRERIAPKVQTLLPFDVPTFQDDDTPWHTGKQIQGLFMNSEIKPN